MSLSMLKPGAKAIITNFESTQSCAMLLKRMMEMGMTIGAEVEVAHHAPFGGGITVRCRGALIALRLSDAERIKVRHTP